MPVRPIPDNPWESAPLVEGDSPWEAAPEVGDTAALGGPGATMSAAPEESFWSEAGRKLKEAIFGHPDRADAKATGVGMYPTTAEMGEAALAGAAAMGGGATLGGLVTTPIRVGMGLAGGIAGEEGGRRVGRVAEDLGAPKGTARAMAIGGSVAGGLFGGIRPKRMAGAMAGALEKPAGTLRRVAAAEAEAATAPEAAAAARGATVTQFPAPQAAPAAAPQAEEIAAKILSLRKEHGLSGAQITSSLRQLYGIPPSQGQKMVEMVLENALMVKR